MNENRYVNLSNDVGAAMRDIKDLQKWNMSNREMMGKLIHRLDRIEETVESLCDAPPDDQSPEAFGVLLRRIEKLEKEVATQGTAIVSPQFLYNFMQPIETWKEGCEVYLTNICQRISQLEMKGVLASSEQCNAIVNGVLKRDTNHEAYTKKEVTSMSDPIPATVEQELDNVQSLYNRRTLEFNALQEHCAGQSRRIGILGEAIEQGRKENIELRKLADQHFDNAAYWHKQAEMCKAKYENLQRMAGLNYPVVENCASNCT